MRSQHGGTPTAKTAPLPGVSVNKAALRAQHLRVVYPQSARSAPGSASSRCGVLSGQPRSPTGASIELLREVSEALGRVPEGFNVNTKLKSLLAARAELWRSNAISHADAELLAFGTLVVEGHHVRLSG